MTLPERGWQGYGRPGHVCTNGLTTRHLDPRCVFGNREGVAHIESHDEVAAYRLRHRGVLPALLAYIEGIGRAHDHRRK